jgi:signal peptide peptidase SppA
MQTSSKAWALAVGHFETLARRTEAVGEVAALREQAELWAARQGAVSSVSGRRASVAVVQVIGGITQRSSWWGVSTEGLVRDLRTLDADKGVHATVLEVDSPGGEVYGVPEAAAAIRELRARKPIVAVANSLAGSAAYYLASQADELLVTPSGEVGSIGVYGMHLDLSEAAKQQGVKVTFVYAGKYKIEGNPFEPLGEEARAEMQAMVDRYYDMFVRDVARGRAVGVETVRSGFGEGRLVGAKTAVELGMADAVGTLDDAVRRAAILAAERRRSAEALIRARAALRILTSGGRGD